MNQNQPIRPLDKGMITNLPSQAVPVGGFVDVGNFNVTQNGLKARGGFAPLTTPQRTRSTSYNSAFNTLTGDVQDTFLFRQNDGQTELLSATNKALYRILQNEGSYERISFSGTLDYDEVLFYASGQMYITQLKDIETIYPTVLMSGTYKEPLKIGDYIQKGTDYGEIVDLSETETHHIIRINVDNTNDWTLYSGDLNGELNFFVKDGLKIDHDLVNGIEQNKIVLTANRYTALAQYDGTGTLSVVPIDSTSTVDPQYDIIVSNAAVCRWYRNRLWIANTIEDGKVLRQRIRWSDPTTYLNLDTADRFRPENYIDLSDSFGEILAIYPMGELLIVYCSDAIYYGRASNISNLPYTFVKINTPGIGLVGQSAITPWMDGHYFVGQDEIYLLDAAASLRPIGTTVLKNTLDVCYNKAGIDVRPDPANSRIVFLFPEDTGDFNLNDRNCSSRLYTYNYKTGAWSYLEAAYRDTPTGDGKEHFYHFGSISSSMLYSGHSSWDTFIDLEPVGINNPATYNWNVWEATYTNWDALKDGELSDHTFLFGLVSYDDVTDDFYQDFYIELTDYDRDNVGGGTIIYERQVYKTLISADYDFGIPDDNKQINRFSLKLENPVTDNTTFETYVSTNRGKTYKPVGDLRIAAGDDEGKVNFRAKGSNFRFKLRAVDLNVNTINEIVIRLSKRSEEK